MSGPLIWDVLKIAVPSRVSTVRCLYMQCKYIWKARFSLAQSGIAWIWVIMAFEFSDSPAVAERFLASTTANSHFTSCQMISQALENREVPVVLHYLLLSGSLKVPCPQHAKQWDINALIALKKMGRETGISLAVHSTGHFQSGKEKALGLYYCSFSILKGSL